MSHITVSQALEITRDANGLVRSGKPEEAFNMLCQLACNIWANPNFPGTEVYFRVLSRARVIRGNVSGKYFNVMPNNPKWEV